MYLPMANDRSRIHGTTLDGKKQNKNTSKNYPILNFRACTSFIVNNIYDNIDSICALQYT